MCQNSKYFGMLLTNLNYLYEDIKNTLNLGNLLSLSSECFVVFFPVYTQRKYANIENKCRNELCTLRATGNLNPTSQFAALLRQQQNLINFRLLR